MPRKIVITCAVTGSFDTRSKNPAVPVTPLEIAESALDAAKAGASVAHIHVRDPATAKPSMELDLYREVVERIREQNEDLIINLTTGAGARFVPSPDDPRMPGTGTTLVGPTERMRHIETLRPELCTLDVATMNFGESIFANIPAHLREMAGRARASGSKPEIEVFDLGHVVLAKRLIADGYIDERPLFQICLGIPYGAPATPEVLLQIRDQLPPNSVWSAFGIAQAEFPIVAVTAAAGGHVRVGLEDNLYLGRGQLAPSNSALVERAARIIELLGYSVANGSEARTIFGLKGH